MARYVMANRRSGKFLDVEKRASRATVAAGLNQLSAHVNVIADRDPADDLARRVVVFEADPEEIAAKAAALPTDCIVEAEILQVVREQRSCEPVGERTDCSRGDEGARRVTSQARPTAKVARRATGSTCSRRSWTSTPSPASVVTGTTTA